MTENQLVKLLKESPSLPILFIGSGLSRRYLQTENWEGLLRHFAKLAQPDLDYPFENYQNLLHEKYPEGKILDILPEIATKIEFDFNAQWHKSPIWQDSRQRHQENIRKGISPFKLVIADYFSEYQLKKDSLDQALHEEIVMIKNISNQSIAGIITTNYDALLETLFPNFIPFIGQEELLFANPQGIGEIYKIHGCHSRPESIILNKNDYDQFEKQNPYLAAKLITLFVEHPIIFLGYSLSDQNITNLLKALVSCFSSDKIKQFEKQLIFIKYDSAITNPIIHPHTISLPDSNNTTLNILSISTSSFTNIFKEISCVTSQYPIPILRRLKHSLYNVIVDKNSARKNLVVHNFHNLNLNDDSIEFVAGVGVIKETGYRIIQPHSIFEDIVLDNGDFNFTQILNETLPYLQPRHGNSIPFYKYLSGANCPTPDFLSSLLQNNFDDFFSKTRQKERQRKQFHSIQDILSSNLPLHKEITQISLLCENEIILNDLQSYLSNLLNTHPLILQAGNTTLTTNALSTLRFIIRIYDWLKYANN